MLSAQARRPSALAAARGGTRPAFAAAPARSGLLLSQRQPSTVARVSAKGDSVPHVQLATAKLPG